MKIFDHACLCNLRISRWSGEKQLTLSDMKKIGINPSEVDMPSEIIKYGKKSLISPHELKNIVRIENRARALLASRSVLFPISGCALVPKKIFADVESKLKELKNDFDKEVDRFILKFDEMKEDLKNRYPDFWEKCLKDFYPKDPQSLRNKFGFNFTSFKIDCLDESKREELQKEVQEFVSDYIVTMRAQTIQFCEFLKSRILGKPMPGETDAKTLSTKSLNSFRKYIDHFSRMNIFGDSEVESMLKDFRRDFIGDTVTKDSFDNASVQKSVVSALDAIKNKINGDLPSKSEFINAVRRKIIL